jgi:hypothetical protein
MGIRVNDALVVLVDGIAELSWLENNHRIVLGELVPELDRSWLKRGRPRSNRDPIALEMIDADLL